MNQHQSAQRVFWKVATLDVTKASLRYRCLLPAANLAEWGWRSTVDDRGAEFRRDPSRFDALVIVKSFTDADIELARHAHRARVPVILDLCDNILVDGYGGSRGPELRANFRQICQIAAQVVVTGPQLESAVQTALGSDVTTAIIPDGLDITSGDHSAILERLLSTEGGSIERAGKPQAGSRMLRRLLQIGQRAGGPATRRLGRKTVLWFGKKGGKYGNNGMRSLDQVAPALVQLDKQIPLELLVVSNSYPAYLRHIASFPVPTRYRPWRLDEIARIIAASEVVVLPFRQHPFDRAKSANRAILSLANGTPVIASPIPALAPLSDVVRFENWADNLKAYLTDQDLRRRDLDAARALIEENYSPTAIARIWADTLAATCSRPADQLLVRGATPA